MYWAIRTILNGRGIPDPPDGSFRLRDDGRGPYIASWDEKALGAQPTSEEIASVPPLTAEDVAKTDTATRTLASVDLRAFFLASFRFEHQRDPTAEERTAWEEQLIQAFKELG